MKQSYESKIQDLSNQITQSKTSSNNQVTSPTQREANLVNPSLPALEEPIFDKSDCAIDP